SVEAVVSATALCLVVTAEQEDPVRPVRAGDVVVLVGPDDHVLGTLTLHARAVRVALLRDSQRQDAAAARALVGPADDDRLTLVVDHAEVLQDHVVGARRARLRVAAASVAAAGPGTDRADVAVTIHPRLADDEVDRRTAR